MATTVVATRPGPTASRPNTKEGAHVKFVTNYIRLENKKKPGDRSCLGLYSKQFRWIMTNLKSVPMSKNHHGPQVAVHHLEIWPAFMTMV